MSSIRVACAQILSTSDPSKNLDLCACAVRQAAADGARLVVLPEAAMARFGTRLVDVAQPLDGPFATGIRDLARETGTWIVAGMFTPADESRVANTVLATDGTTCHTYDKRHMYDAFGSKESKVVRPGTGNVVFDALGTRIGLATCYDIRFAHQFTELGLAGAEIVCLPTSWGAGRGKQEQWQTLVAARGLDAQAYVVACDQAFCDDNPREALGIGHSMIVNPLGHTVAALGDEPGISVTDIDLDLVAKVRENIPVLVWQRDATESV